LSELLLKPDLENCHDIDEIGRGIRMLGNRLDDAVEKCVELVRQGERLLEDESKALTAWREAMAVLGIEEDAESLSINNCEAVADQTIRFKIFLLSTHYWEGRWLLDMDEVLPKLENEKHKNGRVAEMQRWYRRMKLTPCAVSTFYMLPSWMKICQKKGDNFVDNYLYGFADLLIVDEAGQARPDLAGPAFALAKKALIVGDTLQLEPIWSIPHQVDKGNLRTVGLLRNDNYETDYEHLSEIGKSVASGSVMRIAQGATRYHSDSDLARGLFLYEHCRCYDEIIGFCNELCYRGKLIPLRGKRPRADEEKDWLPAMGYLHIDGLCQSCSGGTRQNLLEAETIAAWLCQRKGELEKLYGKPLHKIVGVITPFGGQVVAITRACNKLGIKVGDGKEELTVGTVHSLQGAERPIVIFSPVYSKHSDGPFIDKNLSMLNVTVSRARDSFLIFGDMDVFELIDKVQPRGLLGAYLFRDPGNALRFEYRPREDLLSPRTNLRVLRDAPEHDDFLLKVLLNVRREFGIVSPWLFLHRIEQIGALNGMISAIQRGVNVNVYTDLELNTNDGSKQRRAEQRNMLLSALESLRNHGIKTFLVKRVHSKVVVADDNVFCVGSFNWFSANRDDRYAKHETSMAYQGADLAAEIVAMRKSLELRVVQQRI
jgi:hypothetical protein